MRWHKSEYVESILKAGLDRVPVSEPVPEAVPLPPHDNIRGPTYYN